MAILAQYTPTPHAPEPREKAKIVPPAGTQLSMENQKSAPAQRLHRG